VGRDAGQPPVPGAAACAVAVTIAGLTISNGLGDGGGIFNEGMLAINNSTITGNRAVGATGYSTGFGGANPGGSGCGDWEGNWKEAVAALEKSMELRQGGNSYDWFFLAMAHWQLGEKEKARDWYAKAGKWMDQNQPKNEELRRFRVEAAELLKIEPKKM
jgi:hypothetical protein